MSGSGPGPVSSWSPVIVQWPCRTNCGTIKSSAKVRNLDLRICACGSRLYSTNKVFVGSPTMSQVLSSARYLLSYTSSCAIYSHSGVIIRWEGNYTVIWNKLNHRGMRFNRQFSLCRQRFLFGILIICILNLPNGIKGNLQ